MKKTRQLRLLRKAKTNNTQIKKPKMENPSSLIVTLFEKTEHYVKSGSELLKLKAIDKSAELISTITARLAVIVVFTLFSLFLNIGIALLIGEMFVKAYWGFFIVAGFYALAGTILFIFRNKWVTVHSPQA